MEMILLSAGLFLALLVAIFFISKLYGSLENSLGNKYYVDLENKIEVAAKNYVDEKEIDIDGEYKLSLTTLKNANYITKLEDPNGNSCNGYVTIKMVDNMYHYRGYILCNEYQTQNY